MEILGIDAPPWALESPSMFMQWAATVAPIPTPLAGVMGCPLCGALVLYSVSEAHFTWHGRILVPGPWAW